MNAEQEFISHTAGKEIKCAIVTFLIDKGYRGAYDECTSNEETYTLPIGYTKEEYDKFLQSLDKDYDNGYGGQMLLGFIWYEDGTWSSREGYDDSEEWAWHKCPVIPESLNAK